ncbi:CDP-diacylglycerol--serine O-phosphatidyltransferase [Candidatus Methylospira mobilis]|uniref:CDP-diacylglycerol--serine O-phosphatidyltransferase n=1 Tax=Candidatus Methylospira mobilis TaxID=1808979 RepID=A0A5Q0BPB0_9GAMM|nr:CDP-diacylglycerol--serine O-phosphatidyltransferase [Candidatus Methylospira mobilis]QFY43907.1 CDP-diacylglycerol--serine O-phosphatidyltransferase [Candidatus Methylospira mobilis]WNV04911.1 CDP-diacylglycerol--serine O-phosphatidyltransferase [Candidatus Methylospira mobilis]
MSEQPQLSKRRRGIYLLPNLFTTAAMFAGFYAVTAAINHRFELAAIAVFVSMVLDGMDGRVARMTNTQSEFGGEYDSMSDLISFGVAPAVLIYIWSLSELGKLGWVAAFVHCAGGALRLARFNTQIGTADKRYFQGLASPAAAAIIAGFVWLSIDQGWDGQTLAYVSSVLAITTGLLMVSNIRYYSFKDIDFHGRMPFVKAIMIMLAFAVIFTHPPLTLFAMFAGYAVSGPILTLLVLRQHRMGRKS